MIYEIQIVHAKEHDTVAAPAYAVQCHSVIGFPDKSTKRTLCNVAILVGLQRAEDHALGLYRGLRLTNQTVHMLTRK